MAAHVFLRTMLGPLLGCAPGAVRFAVAANGKPYLESGCARCHREPPRFNLSHSHEKAVLAVAAGADVGVDIEFVRDFAELLNVAADNFAPEEQLWLRSSRDHDLLLRFYTIWTRKEACLKAIGAGLRRRLAEISVLGSQEGDEGQVFVRDESDTALRIDYRDVPAPDGYLIAVAATAPITSVRARRQ